MVLREIVYLALHFKGNCHFHFLIYRWSNVNVGNVEILTLKDGNELDEVDEALEAVAEDEDCHYHQEHRGDHLVRELHPGHGGQLGGRLDAEHVGEFNGELDA